MFDSLIINCPVCKKQLEFQSKSGPCILDVCSRENLTPDIAIGLLYDVVECQFCKNNFELKMNIPEKVKVRICKTKKKAHYSGNYNPKLAKNIKRMKELKIKIK